MSLVSLLVVLISLLAQSHSLYVNYPAAQMGHGWIQIVMRSSDPVHVDTVVWCKSGESNHGDPPPPDINDCTASNLMYLQLYPNKRQYLRYPPEAEFNTLYIDPSDLGGWDLERQFDIIIRGSRGFHQIVRFNPLPMRTSPKPDPNPNTVQIEEQTLRPHPSPIIIEEDEPTPTPTVSMMITHEEAATPIPALASSSSNTPEPTTQQHTDEEQTESSSSPSSSSSLASSTSASSSSLHPWRAAAILLGVGATVITVTTLFIRWRQVRGSRRTVQDGLNAMATLTAYQWNGKEVVGEPGALIEMRDMSGRGGSGGV